MLPQTLPAVAMALMAATMLVVCQAFARMAIVMNFCAYVSAHGYVGERGDAEATEAPKVMSAPPPHSPGRCLSA